MNKLKFSEALNYLSDDTVLEADKTREKPAVRRKRYIKYMAIAACAAIVTAVGVFIALNSRFSIEREVPDGPPATEAPDNSKDSPDAPSDTPNGEVYLLSLPTDMGGAGDGGVFVRDISELSVSEMPNMTDERLLLPVYENATKWYNFYPESTDYDKMVENLKKYAVLYGLDADSLDIRADDPPSAYCVDDLDELFQSLWGIDAPEGVDQPKAIEATQDGITIRVIGEYGVTVGFEDAIPMPEGYSTVTYDGALEVAEYLKKEYGDKLIMANPTASITGGERNVYGERTSYCISFYDKTGDPVQDLVNRNFRRVSFSIYDGELWSISYDITNIDSVVGIYPAITAEEAIELFAEGKYINPAEYDVRDPELVEKVTLIYLNSINSKYYIPCYKLYVYHNDAPIETYMSMHLYDTYYVPAIGWENIEGGDSFDVQPAVRYGSEDVGLGSSTEWLESYPDRGEDVIWWGETLPVYEKAVNYVSCGGNGSYRYISCDADYMQRKLGELVKSFGLDVSECEVMSDARTADTAREHLEQELEKGCLSYPEQIDEMMENYVRPYGYSVETEDYVFEVRASETRGYLAEVIFKNGVPVGDTGEDQIQRIAEQIVDDYGWFLSGNGRIVSDSHTEGIEEKTTYLNIYRESDSLTTTNKGNSVADIETFINSNFGCATARISGGVLESITVSLDESYEKVGDYEILGSLYELTDRINDGGFITWTGVFEPDTDKIVGIELIYSGGQPYFDVRIDITDRISEEESEGHEGERCYGEYLVPAVKSQYYAPFLSESIPEYRYSDKGKYDYVAGDAKPCSDKSYELIADIFRYSDNNAQMGSFYLLEITGVIDSEDAVWLNGYNTMSQDQFATFYKAIAIYDYFEDKAVYENMILRVDGSIETQVSGCPPYSVGDRVAVLVYRDSVRSDFRRMFCDNTFIYDVLSINGSDYLMARGQAVPEIENSLTNYMIDKYAEITTTVSYNPVLYHGAYSAEELSKELKRCCYSYIPVYENEIEENFYGPGSTPFGMMGGEEPVDSGSYIPTGTAEYLYSGVEIDTEYGAATGGAMSYDEWAQYAEPTDRVIAYEITSVYTYDEAVALYGDFNEHRTLYRAHGFYDLLNDCPIDVWFDVAGWGSTVWQEEGWPMYAVGDRFVSTLNDFDEPCFGYQLPDSETEFMLLNVNGMKLAYHIGYDYIRFEGDYPNIDLEMTETERSYNSTTRDNPFIFTQKMSFESLTDFFRDDFWKRGLITRDDIGLMSVKPAPDLLSVDGIESYTADSVADFENGNPWTQLGITEGTTLPVFDRTLSFVKGGDIGGVDYDFAEETVRFYANNLGVGDSLEVSTDAYGRLLWAEADGIRVELDLSRLGYGVRIRIADGFKLSEGAKSDFHAGATREEAESAASELLLSYEWMVGSNDAGRTEVISSSSDRCYVIMYHPLIGYSYIPTDDGSPVPEESSSEVIKTVLNYNFNRTEFLSDGYIEVVCPPGAFDKQYKKLGDYPVITPDEALGRIDSGMYFTSATGSDRTSADTAYTELIWLSDGIPYYKCYVSLSGWQGFGDNVYGAYYVPALQDEYISASTEWSN